MMCVLYKKIISYIEKISMFFTYMSLFSLLALSYDENSLGRKALGFIITVAIAFCIDSLLN